MNPAAYDLRGIVVSATLRVLREDLPPPVEQVVERVRYELFRSVAPADRPSSDAVRHEVLRVIHALQVDDDRDDD